ncbi:F0F1 ATP synthase subunit epsilon [candidate division KSB1 bacterium]|nr:F0F1 ATP synthase subunit epsilon [candidate division KSB1 bacterium]NIR72735.1 F0F1 ATP synthase subunit epsilon [candidate division KSB1 bacterium]NIS26823.1 F0F1 ATP synthase subunit epsilon [candidate division KSB1 bacterium]NIT73617.1 F0F1 ATP synthase subunit epsilon [candidate division KSB1 bacterium]NIU27490.1 F0F1 ATP synthase subunit epsilon [candidate division KSB1 bacterium]
MPDKINFELLTPDRKVYSDGVSSVRLPGLKGYFGVHPGHTFFLAALKIGEIRVKIGNEISYFATSGGFAEVLPHSVSVLAESAESATSIDVERAKKAKDRAAKRLEEGRKSWDMDRAKAALARAINRIRVASEN